MLVGFSHNAFNATLEHFEQRENMICSVLIIQPKYRKIMHQLSQIISKLMVRQREKVLPCTRN